MEDRQLGLQVIWYLHTPTPQRTVLHVHTASSARFRWLSFSANVCLSVTFSEAVLSLCNVGQLSLLSRSLSTSPMHLKLFLTLIPSALQSFSPPCLCLSLSRPSSVSSLINCCCSHAVFFFLSLRYQSFPQWMREGDLQWELLFCSTLSSFSFSFPLWTLLSGS